MVCPRCIETVQSVLQEKGFNVHSIKLGEVEIDREPNDAQMDELSVSLQKRGFELLTDRKTKITDIAIGENVLEWRVCKNGVCASDYVTIMNKTFSLKF